MEKADNIRGILGLHWGSIGVVLGSWKVYWKLLVLHKSEVLGLWSLKVRSVLLRIWGWRIAV